jgi:hypothetical protein
MQPHDAAEQHQHHAWSSELPSATQHITADGSPSRFDKQQLLQDSIMLLEHRAQLQGQVCPCTLQGQVCPCMLGKHVVGIANDMLTPG